MKLLDSLRFRIATLFQRSQMNAEMEDELRSHIQHRADDLERSGMGRGFTVVADHTEDVVFKQLQDVTPAHIAAVAKRVVNSAPSADGVYIPCNHWSGADAAPLIEKECGVPVVTGAHADYWEAFRSLGIDDRIEGHGRLMASLSNGRPAAALAHG